MKIVNHFLLICLLCLNVMIGHCNPTLRSAVNDADACRWLFDDKRYPVVPADASGCPRCRRHVHFFLCCLSIIHCRNRPDNRIALFQPSIVFHRISESSGNFPTFTWLVCCRPHSLNRIAPKLNLLKFEIIWWARSSAYSWHLSLSQCYVNFI